MLSWGNELWIACLIPKIDKTVVADETGKAPHWCQSGGVAACFKVIIFCGIDALLPISVIGVQANN